MNSPAIQLYSQVLDKKGKETSVLHSIETIAGRTGESALIQQRIDKLRELREFLDKSAVALETTEKGNEGFAHYVSEFQHQYDDLKKGLPAVTWSGTFSSRSAKNLQQYSGIICIDIDKLNVHELEQARELFKVDPYTYCYFVSPSGNGLKVLFRVAASPDQHKNIFIAIEKYIFDKYQIAIDPSGKDVSRLCFLSYDESLFVNLKCQVFDLPKEEPINPVEPPKPVKFTKKEQDSLIASDDTPAGVWASTEQNIAYTEGNRNNFLYKFACNCNRKGVDMTAAEAYAVSQAVGMKDSEVETTIRSAYTHNAAEWAKYAKRQKNDITASSKNSRKNSTGNSNAASLPGKKHNAGNSNLDRLYDESKFIPFWYETEDKKNTDKDGNPVKRFNIYYSGLIDFLSQAGFYRLPMANKTFDFIRYADNVCDTVPLHEMRDHVMNWCQEYNKTQVREMLLRGSERYFNMNKLASLPYKKPEFVKDSKEEAFFFFRNCYVKITPESIEARPISELNGSLWKTDIIDRDFSIAKLTIPTDEHEFMITDKMECEMMRYVALVSHNPKNKDSGPEVTRLRFESICNSIGYMLHGWKSKIGKAIVAVDHKIPEDKSEQNGGTGKSIIGESFKYLKSTCIIDGREFKDDYPFRFERIRVDTKITVMQDCKYSMDFGSFFVPITNDFTYNRRHTGYVTIPYEDSAKWWFDTNFVFKGEGSSFRRRMHVIEFDDYFDENYTPFDEFQHMLFTDWDAHQWNLFYNFYFMCVQNYLLHGLIPYPESNYENRKLLVETPQEFIDWLDAIDDDKKFKIRRNIEHVKKELMKEWNNEAAELNMNKPSAHQFSKWVKKYCHTKGYKLLKKKTNGMEYYVIADEKYRPGMNPVQEQNLFANNQ